MGLGDPIPHLPPREPPPLEISDIRRMVLRPGDLVLIRYRVPESLDRIAVNKYLEIVKRTFREALDRMGLEEVQVIVHTDDVDISVISGVELLGALSSGVSADEGE